MTFLRWVLLIARNEWGDAFRSRRALVILLLYLSAAVLSMNGLLSGILRLEKELGEMLLLSASPEPGAVIDALWNSARFRDIVAGMVRSESLAAELIGVSPVALAFAGLAFLYLPFLVALIAPVRVSEELAGGAVRYVLLRAPRLAWSLGKFLGQILFVIAGLLLSALGAWIITAIRLPAANHLAIGWSLLEWTARVGIYGVAYTGLALGVAHLTRSPGRATALALFAVIGMSLLAWASTTYDDSWLRGIGPILYQLTPQAYRSDLWRQSTAYILPSALALLCLGFSYLLAGYAAFRRRDV
ncbi:MAG TPA: ABC transporter permease subunit [Kiritimatiellia bacterium]|nr:ABC transporter permease subunit [Kiritimatiellia bacterium]